MIRRRADAAQVKREVHAEKRLVIAQTQGHHTALLVVAHVAAETDRLAVTNRFNGQLLHFGNFDVEKMLVVSVAHVPRPGEDVMLPVGMHRMVHQAHILREVDVDFLLVELPRRERLQKRRVPQG